MIFRPGPPRDRRELPERFRFGTIEVDVPGVRVRREGVAIALEPKAFDLLLLLAANPGRVLVKEEIFERLWPDAAVADNALTRVVAHLRRELRDDAAEAGYIETVRTRGYRFLPEIEAAAGPAPARPASPAVADAAPTAAAPAAGEATPPLPPARPQPSVAAPPEAAPAGHGTASRASRGVLVPALVALAVASIVIVALVVVVARRPVPGRAGMLAETASPEQLTVRPGYDGLPSFSPDGAAIAYSSERESGLEVAVRRLDDGRELVVTSGEAAVNPVWSPDGRWIAFASGTRGGIWLVSPLGGEPRQVTSFGGQPAWSPDSRRLVFRSQGSIDLTPLSWAASMDAILWTVDIDKGDARPLTRPGLTRGGHGWPTWSPDGETIVFAAGGYEATALYRVRASGGDPEPLTAFSDKSGWLSRFVSPVFTPDGGSVLALRSGIGYSIVRVQLASGATDPVVPIAPSGMASLAISRDGSRLAYTTAELNSSIEEAPLTAAAELAGKPRQLVAGGGQRVSTPCYSPGGDALSYSRFRPGSASDVEVLDLASGQTRSVAAGAGRGFWIARGELVLGAPRASRAVDVDTGRHRELPGLTEIGKILDRHEATTVDVSRDLRQVAFSGRVDDTIELFVWAAGDADARQLTRLGGIAHYPRFSRDARLVAFQRPGMEGGRSEELWVMPTAGGQARRLVQGTGRSWSVVFSPDGRRVAYAAQRRGLWDVGVADVEGGAGEHLLGVNDSWTSYIRYLDWSPDGTAIAYERTRITGEVWLLRLGRQSGSRDPR